MKRATIAAMAVLMFMLTFAAYAADYQGCPGAGGCAGGACPAYGNQAQCPRMAQRRTAPRYQRRATAKRRYTVGRTYRGYATGGVPGVRLTADQQRRVASIRRDTQNRARQVMRDFKLTPRERVTRWNDIRREGHDRVMTVLTPEQRAQFNAWAARNYVGAKCAPPKPSAMAPTTAPECASAGPSG